MQNLLTIRYQCMHLQSKCRTVVSNFTQNWTQRSPKLFSWRHFGDRRAKKYLKLDTTLPKIGHFERFWRPTFQKMPEKGHDGLKYS